MRLLILLIGLQLLAFHCMMGQTLESSAYPGLRLTNSNAQIRLWGESGEKWSIGSTGAVGDDLIFYDMVAGNRMNISATTGNVYIYNNLGLGGSFSASGAITSNTFFQLNHPSANMLIYHDDDLPGWSLLRSNTGNGIGIIGQPDQIGISVSRSTTNVGIGTTDPTEKLEVAGNIKIKRTSQSKLELATQSEAYKLTLESNYNSTNRFNLISGVSNILGDKAIVNNLSTTYLSGYYGMAFLTATTDVNPNKVRMYINNIGNVGIGTVNPVSKLDFGSNYSDPSDHPNKITLWSNGANNYFGFGISNGDLDYISQHNHRFYTGFNGSPGSEKMVIKSNGHVGIGVSDPGGYIISALGNAKVGGNIAGAFIDVVAEDEAGAPATAAGIRIKGYEGRGKGIFISDKNTTHNWFIGDGYNYAGLGIGYNSSASQTEYAVNNKMYIHPNGDVGIGTIYPDAKLAVKGIIHTQEVRVDLAGAVAPDYVFEPDYDLLSLSEIKSFIEKEKHLPEVPSAEEMGENGINLKEMNLLLLKKVEELTLHLIEQNESLQQIQVINKELAKRINKLENKE